MTADIHLNPLHWVEFKGKRLRAALHGQSDTRLPVLLIHGFGGSLDVWDPMLDALTANRRVIRLDWPGHGESDPLDGDYQVAALAEAAQRVVSHFDVNRCHVVAHSAGGDVAIAMAEQRPECIAGMCLLGTSPNLSFVQMTFASRLVRLPVVGKVLWDKTSDEMVRAGLRKTFAPGRADVPEIYVRSLRRLTHRTYTESIGALERYKVDTDLCLRVSRLGTCPLVIFGAMDQWVSPKAAEYWARTTGVVVKLLDRAGHTPMAEAPQETSSLILDYIENFES